MRFRSVLGVIALLLGLTAVTAPPAQAIDIVWQHSAGGFGTTTWLYNSPWLDSHYYGNPWDASIAVNCDETNAYAHRWVVLDIKGGIGPDVVRDWTVHSDVTLKVWQIPTDTLDIQFTVNSQGCKWTISEFHP
jgi:hypothetical protein